MKPYRDWLVASLIGNGTLLVVLAGLWPSRSPLSPFLWTDAERWATLRPRQAQADDWQARVVGERQSLDYQQWLGLLSQEARAIARTNPPRLHVLLGDSISLWFDPQWLPPDAVWLNQGLSGEKTEGLLERLDLLAPTEPDVIFVMIGINDLLWAVESETVIANYRLIVERLQRQHPDTEIVIQSILPHAGRDRATWEGKARLDLISNRQIERLNRELAAIAIEYDVHFLDLFPLFADEQGNLNADFSSDGLHLNATGYQVWSAAIKLFTQLEL